MAFRDYLAAFLLGASAFFFFPLSHEAKAEDKEISVEFRYSGVEKLKNPGSDLEGKLKASAWREGTKLCLQVDAENCQLHSSTEYFIGLPIEVDITSITQKARVNARTKDGRGYEEQWITLFDNKGLERGGKILLGPVIGVFEVPFVTDVLMDEVENEKETRTRERTRKMKNEKLILIQIPRQYPDRPLAYPTNFSRLIEITLDKEPSTTPQFLFRAWAQDNRDRVVTTDDVYLRCDARQQAKEQSQTAPKIQSMPVDLELLLKDAPATASRLYTPTDLSELFKLQVTNSCLAQYSLNQNKYSLDFWIIAGSVEEINRNNLVNLISQRIIPKKDPYIHMPMDGKEESTGFFTRNDEYVVILAPLLNDSKLKREGIPEKDRKALEDKYWQLFEFIKKKKGNLSTGGRKTELYQKVLTNPVM